MISTTAIHKQSTEEKQKIELILIQQCHLFNIKEVSSEFTLDDENSKVIYSQFKIMQIVQSYPDAAILAEGFSYDGVPGYRSEKFASILKQIFPQYKNLCDMEFDQLTETQKTALAKNDGVAILFHMGIIPCIYQAEGLKQDMKKVISDYADSYRETLINYPILADKAMRNGDVSLKDLDTIEELEDYKKFMKTVAQKNPGLFYNKEKEALDFVLTSAKKSGKKQVVLVYGRSHASGFSELIDTIYRDKIILKKSIDSCEGFNHPDQRKELQILHQEATKYYKSGEYKAAIAGFKSQVCFWQATPKSTPTKSSSLLTAEFNLGSSYFKLAESDETLTYEEAIPHLKNAVTLAQEINKSNKKQEIKKYVDRYSEAVKRDYVISFFNKTIHMPHKISRLITSYVYENEPVVPRVSLSR
jgi:hypothetical protein